MSEKFEPARGKVSSPTFTSPLRRIGLVPNHRQDTSEVVRRITDWAAERQADVLLVEPRDSGSVSELWRGRRRHATDSQHRQRRTRTDGWRALLDRNSADLLSERNGVVHFALRRSPASPDWIRPVVWQPPPAGRRELGQRELLQHQRLHHPDRPDEPGLSDERCSWP